MRADGKGPADREIPLVANVCGQEHGGPQNDAEVYGHHASRRVCTRVKHTTTWVYDVRRAPVKIATKKD